MRFLVGQANMKRLDNQLALQCAPVILGIKISNMLIVDSIYKNAVKCIFHDTELSCHLLCKNNYQVIFLIYYQRPLRMYLQEDCVLKLMQQYGYNTKSLQLILEEFTRRYVVYLRTKRKFPHELGLLLGYPVDDVVGFIQNRGKNYIYSGYWKVYKELDYAMQTFTRYEKAKMLLLSWVLRGGSIRAVLTFRKEKGRDYGNYRKRVIDKL
jgi:hypothetical protein